MYNTPSILQLYTCAHPKSLFHHPKKLIVNASCYLPAWTCACMHKRITIPCEKDCHPFRCVFGWHAKEHPHYVFKACVCLHALMCHFITFVCRCVPGWHAKEDPISMCFGTFFTARIAIPSVVCLVGMQKNIRIMCSKRVYVYMH
jgi:hypothetical protein